MLNILSGVFLLFLSMYMIYQGSVIEHNWLRILGFILLLISGVYVALARLKINIKKMDNYKEALYDLSKNPEDETLKEKAYHQGISYYKNKRDNRKVLPMDKMAIERDIAMAIQKGKK